MSKTNWQYPQSLVLRIPVSNLLKRHFQWWKIKKKRDRHIMGCLNVIANILSRRYKGLVHLGLLQSLKYTHKRQTYSGLLKSQEGTKSNPYRMVLTNLKVQDNLHVWHTSTIAFICRFAVSWPAAILEIFSYEPDIFRVA